MINIILLSFNLLLNEFLFSRLDSNAMKILCVISKDECDNQCLFFSKNVTDDEYSLAKELLIAFGNSSLDYYKTYSDKMIFFSDSRKAFIAYRISGNFAVILENPVAENEEELIKCISQIDTYFYQNGLKSIYYRVPEETLPAYHELRK